MGNIDNKRREMKKEVIKKLSKVLSAGNSDLGLLLDWSARIEAPVLKTLWNHQQVAAGEIMVLGVNARCGTNFKRCDLLGCDGFFDTVSTETKMILREKADVLREKAKELTKQT